MKLLKNITIFLLVLNTIGSVLTVPLIHLDFELRRDYIAKVLCINRTKPMTVCGGHCYLNKQLEKAAPNQEQDTQTTNRLLEISFFNQKFTHLVFDGSLNESLIDFPNFDARGHTSTFIDSVFKPPRSRSSFSPISVS